MRQAEVIVAMGKSELLAQPLLAFAQRGDSPPHGRHMLANRQVDAFDSPPYTFFLLNDNMELNRNRQFLV